jgi:predicted enzyme involved in methoxymalonyl-ACP biosynthesis
MTERKTYAQIQAETGNKLLAALPPLRITILRNVMVEPIEPYLRFYAKQMDHRATVLYGGYNTLYQEAVGGSPDLFAETECVLVWVKLENVSWELARNFNGQSVEQRKKEVVRVCVHLGEIARGIRQQTRAMILWFGFEAPLEPALGIADSQCDAGQKAAIAELNQFLREMLREQGNGYVIDMNTIMGRVGADHFHDARLWHMARAPYGREALREMAFEAFKYVRALRGKSRKCLVLDCDNVLWGGVVGEDGLASGLRLLGVSAGSARTAPPRGVAGFVQQEQRSRRVGSLRQTPGHAAPARTHCGRADQLGGQGVEPPGDRARSESGYRESGICRRQ